MTHSSSWQRLNQMSEPRLPSNYNEELIINDGEPDHGQDVVAEYDYAEGPEWSLPRDWCQRNQYDCEI